MKKLICLVLTLILCLGVLAACVDSYDNKGTNTTENTAVQDNEAATGQNQNLTEDNNTSVVPVTENSADVASGDVLVDNDIVKVVAKGHETDDIWGFTLKLSIENKCADKNITVSSDYIAVNGVESTAILYTDIVVGKTANEEIVFYDDFDEDDIGAYSDIEIAISVTEQDDFLSDPLAEAVFSYYPMGKDKATKFKFVPEKSDEVLVDKNDILFVVTDYEYDDLWGYTVEFYLQNNTDNELMFSAYDVSVNNVMLDPYFVQSVHPGKATFSKMYWLESDFEDNSIKDVKTIEFTLQANDINDFMADDVINQKITLKPTD